MNQAGQGGFLAYYTDAKVAALKAAFELVEPKPNWKAPINAVVPRTAPIDEIVEAVAFYTGAKAKVKPAGGKSVRIIAAGYYETVGA